MVKIKPSHNKNDTFEVRKWRDSVTAKIAQLSQELEDLAASLGISDEAFGVSWNGNTTNAASKNALYDKIATQDTTISGKENSITAGTTAQYWRGDKTWQTLNKSAVGLGNVDDTSDATKNSATVTLTNKTISGSNNTLLNIPISSVTNLQQEIDSVNNTFSSYVPYSGATGAVNLGDRDFTAGETVINKVGVGSTASAVVNLRLRSSYLGNWEYNLQNDRTTLVFRFQYQGVDKWTFHPVTNVLAISGSLSYTGDLSVGSTNFLGLNSSKIQIYNGSNGNLVIQACVFNSTLSRIVFNTGSPTSTKMMVGHDGKVSIGNGTSTPTALLDINSDVIRLRTAKTPSSATDTGNQGDFCWDANYFYICTATNTWRRAAHATW